MNKYLSILFFLLFSSVVSSQVYNAQKPNWVKKVEFSKDKIIPHSELSQGIYVLLSENQINLKTAEHFIKMSYKIIDNSGVQNFASISINHDPKYQQVRFHDLSVEREGKIIVKKERLNFNTYNVESNTESLIYDESKTSTAHLDDIRVGDIITYCYSIKGFNPILEGNFSYSHYVSDNIPFGKSYLKIITDRKLNIKNLNCAITPQVTNFKKSASYIWTTSDYTPKPQEENIPIWCFTDQIVLISTYENWLDVSSWATKTFKISNTISKELQTTIVEIQKNNPSEIEKIESVLNFVQNEIRYLGLESGIGAYKPNSPNKVFKQRYGDCKDKSLLMVAMLKKMGIEAYPFLVNTYLGKGIPALLPSYSNFNHCIVKVVPEEGASLWFDPTFTDQGGGLYSIYTPDYGYGLTVSDKTVDLERMNVSDHSESIVYDEFTFVENSSKVNFTSRSVFKGSVADNFRSIFKTNNKDFLQEEFLKVVSNYYNNPKIKDSIYFTDDEEQNTFTVFESYELDSVWEPSHETNTRLIASFHPASLYQSFFIPNQKNRNNPYLLLHPVKKEHNILIKLNKGVWNIENTYFNIDSNEFFYDFMSKFNKETNEVDISYIYRSRKDNVSSTDFNRYYYNMQRLKQNIGFNLVKNYDSSFGGSFSNDNISTQQAKNFTPLITLGIYIWILSILVWFAIKVYKLNPRKEISFNYEIDSSFNLPLFSILAYLFLNILYTFVMVLEEYNYRWYETILDKSNVWGGIYSFFSVSTSIASIVFTFLTIVLFIQKRSNLLRVISILLISQFVIALIDYLASIHFMPITRASDNRYLLPLGVFCKTLIILMYLLTADKPKEVFTKKWK